MENLKFQEYAEIIKIGIAFVGTVFVVFNFIKLSRTKDYNKSNFFKSVVIDKYFDGKWINDQNIEVSYKIGLENLRIDYPYENEEKVTQLIERIKINKNSKVITNENKLIYSLSNVLNRIGLFCFNGSISLKDVLCISSNQIVNDYKYCKLVIKHEISTGIVGNVKGIDIEYDRRYLSWLANISGIYLISEWEKTRTDIENVLDILDSSEESNVHKLKNIYQKVQVLLKKEKHIISNHENRIYIKKIGAVVDKFVIFDTISSKSSAGLLVFRS